MKDISDQQISVHQRLKSYFDFIEGYANVKKTVLNQSSPKSTYFSGDYFTKAGVSNEQVIIFEGKELFSFGFNLNNNIFNKDTVVINVTIKHNDVKDLNNNSFVFNSLDMNFEEFKSQLKKFCSLLKDKNNQTLKDKLTSVFDFPEKEMSTSHIRQKNIEEAHKKNPENAILLQLRYLVNDNLPAFQQELKIVENKVQLELDQSVEHKELQQLTLEMKALTEKLKNKQQEVDNKKQIIEVEHNKPELKKKIEQYEDIEYLLNKEGSNISLSKLKRICEMKPEEFIAVNEKEILSKNILNNKKNTVSKKRRI